MPSKIKIKVGSLEVEYEGEHEYLQGELVSLIERLTKLAPTVPASAPPPRPPAGGGTGDSGFTGTVSTVASKLKVNGGPELIQAALLHAAIVESKESLPRKELLEAMQGATAFYKTTYSGNLSKQLRTLTKNGKVNEVSTEVYALAPSTRESLEKLFVNGQ